MGMAWDVCNVSMRLIIRWKLDKAYAINPDDTSKGGIIDFPMPSVAGVIFEVTRRVAIVAKRLCSARWRPGQILRVMLLSLVATF
jgi:hypothetical protein